MVVSRAAGDGGAAGRSSSSGPGVEHRLGRRPGAARHLDAPAQVAERRRPNARRSRRPDARPVPSETGVRVVEVQPIDLAVDLERDAVPRRRGNDLVDVETQSVALAAAAGPSDGRARRPMGDSSARRTRSVICWIVLAEMRVDRGDDDIELRQAVVGEIEPSVGEDVALDAGEQRQPLEPPVERSHPAACSSARCSSSPLAMASALL